MHLVWNSAIVARAFDRQGNTGLDCGNRHRLGSREPLTADCHQPCDRSRGGRAQTCRCRRWPSATASTPICCSRCRVSFHERGRRLIVGRAGFPSSARLDPVLRTISFDRRSVLAQLENGGGCFLPPQVGLVLDAFGSGQQTGIDITWRRRDARSAARARRGTVGALAAEGLGRKGTRRSGRSVGAGACQPHGDCALRR